MSPFRLPVCGDCDHAVLHAIDGGVECVERDAMGVYGAAVEVGSLACGDYRPREHDLVLSTAYTPGTPITVARRFVAPTSQTATQPT